MIDELCETIDMARDLFSIKEVSSETNPNHLTHEYLEKLKGRVQRLSVGVQSFDDDLLRQMDRYEKYGSGQEILERIQEASPYFISMNADMIFQLPGANRGHAHSRHRDGSGLRCEPDDVLSADGLAVGAALARCHGGQG